MSSITLSICSKCGGGFVNKIVNQMDVSFVRLNFRQFIINQ